MKNEKIAKIKKPIVEILKKYGVKKAGVFGSYARGEEEKGSDIDILIQPTKNMGIEFVGIKLELEDKLGRKVDLVSYKGINPHLKKYILKDEVKII
jgi:hypothetical protein